MNKYTINFDDMDDDDAMVIDDADVDDLDDDLEDDAWEDEDEEEDTWGDDEASLDDVEEMMDPNDMNEE